MNWITDFQNLLQKALEQKDLVNARILIDKLHELNVTYTASLCYLESALCYYEARYPLSLFWAKKGYSLDPDYSPLHELLSLLTGQPEDNLQIDLSDFSDVSFQKRKLRVLLIDNSIPSIHYTILQFAKDLSALGHETFVFYLEDIQAEPQKLKEFMKEKIDFGFTINNIGILFSSKDGVNWWNRLHIPFVDYLFDHPFYFLELLTHAPETTRVACVDKNHVSFIRRYHPHLEDAFFLPLGSEEIVTGESIPWKERQIEALYVGSLKKRDEAIKDAFSEKVMGFMRNNTGFTTEYAIEHCLKNLSMEERRAMFEYRFPEFALNEDFEITDSFVKQIIHIYCFCDTNTNSIYREKLVAELVKAGIHVHVYGNGWENVDFKNSPYYHYGGFLTQEECILKMQNTKFILNSMPWFKDGTHDRIYNAMLSGGLCITDPSRYLQEQFTHRVDILYYSLDEIEKLPELLRYYENHPNEAEKIIENGYDKVVLCHTWQNRCLELLEYVCQNMLE